MKILINGCFALTLFAAFCFAQNYYKPLTKAERREFVRDAEAVKIANNDGNYAGVIRFGRGIVEKYESILLDPSSRGLRPLYDSIKDIVDDVALRVVADSFELNLEKVLKSGDYYQLLQRYDEYFDYLAGRGSDTAGIGKHKTLYQQSVLRYFDGSFDKLKDLTGLRYVSVAVLDSLRHIVEVSFRDVFVGVMASSNIGDLFQFKVDYPGLYTQEIGDLIANHKAKWRSSLKRWPSIDKIEQYYVVYPEKDKMVDSVYQKLLYADFRKNQDLTSASKYLSCFPNGLYSRELLTFVDVQQEQQRIVQMQTLKDLQRLSRQMTDGEQ